MRRINKAAILLLSLAYLMTLSLRAQIPKGTSGTFALTNATIETVTKGTIPKGTLIISDGKIQAVGANVPVPSGATIIDCAGLVIYPGMIDGGTTLGLSEIKFEERTTDYREIGDVDPQMKALTAINPSSVLIPVTRVNGVTSVISSPSGGLFSGVAALINLYGYTSDQMYAGFQGMVLIFPSSVRKNNFDKRTDDEISKGMLKSLHQLNDVWEKALQYYTLDSATRGKGVDWYPEMQALLPVVRGEMPLLIEVNAANDIRAALKWVDEHSLKKVIFTGVAEGWRVADLIAKAGIPVITGPVLSPPKRTYDRYDKAYANAGLMKKAGVKVALRTKDSENVRNLPYHAGFAASYGLGREEALKAVTIVPAEIFGVADKLGSLEAGKQANLFVCTGDPFEPKTQIKYLFINGWQIPLVTRQTQLYDEYLKREPGLEKK